MQKQYNDNLFFDERYRGLCVQCHAASPNTNDHVPGRAFLVKPYPNNLHSVPTCKECNEKTSKNEEYTSFIIKYLKYLECGDNEVLDKFVTDGNQYIENCLFDSMRVDENLVPFIDIDFERVKQVVTKYAVAHINYEMSKLYDIPDKVNIAFKSQLSEETIEQFEQVHFDEVIPEIGSRASMKIIIMPDNFSFSAIQTWNVVQDGYYRYIIDYDTTTRIRIVIGEILFCEVIWE